MIHSMLFFYILAAFAIASTAAPNPVVNRNDAGGGKPPSPPAPASSSYSSSISISSSTIVSSACESYITLAPRNAAVDRIDGPDAHPKSTSAANSDCEFYQALNEDKNILGPRNPAINRIDAVGTSAAAESVISLAGGNPVTLAASAVDELDAAAYISQHHI